MSALWHLALCLAFGLLANVGIVAYSQLDEHRFYQALVFVGILFAARAYWWAVREFCKSA